MQTAISQKNPKFIRYPGGKQRLLNFLIQHLPHNDVAMERFVEPFVGGGAVFFAMNPRKAFLSDINPTLIDLYRGIKRYPMRVWKLFEKYPPTKKAYYKIRDSEIGEHLASKAAKTLYLNRTCFKGMWRENAQGQFNVGYGGQERRWVITQETIMEVSMKLRHAKLMSNDFEPVIDDCKKGDFIFADPPYRPGEKDLYHSHYVYSKFGFEEYRRLRPLNNFTFHIVLYFCVGVRQKTNFQHTSTLISVLPSTVLCHVQALLPAHCGHSPLCGNSLQTKTPFPIVRYYM